MALATAAAIASLASTGIGIGKSLFGGNQQANQSFGLLADQLALARQNATQAGQGGALINQMARAGFTDSMGNALRFDPATGQWVSTLGPLPQRAQTASDLATIMRNTTDMRMAQAANEQAATNAMRAQPMIDAAMRRFQNFQPMTADRLTGLLTTRVADANNQTFRPIVQDAVTQAARTGTGAGDILAKLGRESAGQLRQGMNEAQIQGMTGAEQVNNARRQGLLSDLQGAIGAGTAQFQFPSIATNNPNKDMISALTSRALFAPSSMAAGLNAQTGAVSAAGSAAGAAAGKVPDPLAGLSGAESGLGSLSQFLGTNTAKTGLSFLSGLFGPGPSTATTNPSNFVQDEFGNLTPR